MKRLIPIVLAAAAVAGCATSSMKSTPLYSGSERVYTGRIEDRVNLWPIAYYREPALSVLWPIFSLTDDHLAIRPIYSQYRQDGKNAGYDEFNFVWPFCQFDTKHDQHRIFPLFWGDKHVDLFPLVWWRFNKSFTLFPLVWWKDDRYFNVFPLWWSDNRSRLFLPFYFQDENTLAVLPFYGKTSHLNSFTEWYGPYGRHRDEKSPEQNYDWCFPFYYRDATSFETPLFGWDRNDHSSWAFPFYYKDHNDFVSLPWVSSRNSDGNDEWIAPLLLSGGESGKDKSMFFSPVWYSNRDDKAKSSSWAVPPLLSWGWDDKDGTCDEYLLGLAGRGTGAEGRNRYWTFPLFYRDDRTFLSTFWCAGQNEQATADYWVVPPLLSWGSRGDEGWSQRYLLGLAGVEREKDGGYADWVAPLYYRNKDSFFSLPWCEIEGAYVIPPLLTIFDGNSLLGNPLFGWDGSCSWAFPLWYKDDKTFASLLWYWDWGDDSDTYVVPPLLSWAERSDAGVKKMRFLLGLGGVSTGRNADDDCSWAFPLYYNDGRRFISLLFGHEKDNFTYVTPLFGVTHKEHKKGAWFWPLFGWANDTNMEAAEAQLNAERLDPKIAVKTQTTVYAATKYAKARTNVWYDVTGTKAAHDESWRLSGLSTSDRWISWSSQADKAVTATDRSETGNIFAYKSKSCREVAFDVKTRKKIRDDEEGESGVFCNFLWHSKYEHVQGWRHYDKKSILWRFWHYENTNGDVSVDSFPFFTYDSKTNGYSKTSLCWRLFRNEYDPKTDKRAVDFLFVPVWR